MRPAYDALSGLADLVGLFPGAVRRAIECRTFGALGNKIC